MQFTTKPNVFIPKIEEKWWDRFTSQPHQLYFSSAIFFALLIMFLTFISFLGKYNLDFPIIHGFGLNYAVFTNAFLGFLITVMPKFNGSIVIAKNKYLIPWFIFQFASIITLLGFINIGKILASLTMFYFVKIFYETIKIGKAQFKKDSIYLNLAFSFGAFFLLLEILLQTNLSLLIFFSYLVCLVFIVAQRMVPAFYGAYMQTMSKEKPKYIREISTFLFLGLGISLQFDFSILLKIFSFLSMIFFAYIIINFDFYKKTPAIISILVVSFIWFEIGFITLFIESFFEIYSLKLALHIFALGFVTTLLIGFGSRVVMGHAVPAQPIIADKITIFIFILTQILVISRVATSISFLTDSTIFSGLLHLSSWLWITIFMLWCFRYFKTLVRI